MRRRRMGRHRPRKQNSRMKFVWFIVIIIGTVLCGYVTARFLVGPLLGYDTEVLKLDFPSKMAGNVKTADKDQKDDEQKKQGQKYILQFGVFSTKDGAAQLQETLEKDGINTSIEKEDGQYKVISDTYSTKEKALKELETLKEQNDIDVFITSTD